MFETKTEKTAQELQRSSLRLFASYGTTFESTVEATSCGRDAIVEPNDEGLDWTPYTKGRGGKSKNEVGLKKPHRERKPA